MKGFQVVCVLSLASAIFAECPKEEHLVLWGCRCYGSGRVQCNDIQDDRQLRFIMTACHGYELLGFTMRNMTLEWLPENLFQPINTEEFALINSALLSLSKPVDGNRLFKGSGIKSFVIDNTEIQDGDLSQIGDLERLDSLAIRNYRGTFRLSSIVKDVQTSAIQTFILENTPGFVWSPQALGGFNHLIILYLSGLNLEKITRDDLSKDVSSIEHICLKNNNLREIPKHFLDGMTSLQSLDLSGNSLTTLDEETFASFSGDISIQENPFICDSKIEWIRKRVAAKTLRLMTVQPVRCADGSILVQPNFQS